MRAIVLPTMHVNAHPSTKKTTLLCISVVMAVLAATVLVGCRAGALKRALDRDVTYSKRKPLKNTKKAETLAIVASDDTSDSPVAVLIINDDRITVDAVLKPVLELLTERSMSMPPAQYTQFLHQAVQSRVRMLARDTLLYQEAASHLEEQQMKSIEAFADDSIRERVNKEFAGRQTRFERALIEEGTTLSEERDRVRREIIVVHWLRNDLSKRIANPTRDELWSVFQDQKESLRKPPRRAMQLIELSILKRLPENVRSPSRAQLETARKATLQEANTVLTRLISGEDFAEVAKAYSDGPNAANGGRWGWVTRGSVRSKWEPAVDMLFQLTDIGVPGELVETQDAYFIVQCAEIDPGVEPVFESIQPELIQRYRDNRLSVLIEELVNELQDKAHIRPKRIDRFLRAIVEAAPQSSGPHLP